MAMVVNVLNYEDGFYSVRIKPEVGEAYSRDFSKAALDEYVEAARFYCEHKGYEFVFKDVTEEADRLYSRNEDGTEENDYILVECNYSDAKDSYERPDAVSFVIGQYVGDEKPDKKWPFEIDNVVSVSTEEARLFAQAILNLCAEIEK